MSSAKSPQSSFDAILFPSDGRPPCIVKLVTSAMSFPTQQPGAITPTRMPHPEVHMDFIETSLGPRAWRFQLLEALDGMSRKFANPYVIFYPTVARDGMPFPENKAIKAIQGASYREELAWRGNVLIAKYRADDKHPFSSFMDANMADFPLLKNYLFTHGSPIEVDAWPSGSYTT